MYYNSGIGGKMEKDKLIIKSKKYKGESTVVSTRLPFELLNKFDDVANKTGRTRNEIIQMCLEFAIDNLEIKGEENGKDSGNN